MGLLSNAECEKLIELLLDLPNIDDAEARDVLVAGLGKPFIVNLAESNIAQTHIRAIVEQANNTPYDVMPDGSSSLLSVVDKAIALVPDTYLALNLREIRDVLQLRVQEQKAKVDSGHTINSTPGNGGSPRVRTCSLNLTMTLVAVLLVAVSGIYFISEYSVGQIASDLSTPTPEKEPLIAAAATQTSIAIAVEAAATRTSIAIEAAATQTAIALARQAGATQTSRALTTPQKQREDYAIPTAGEVERDPRAPAP